nr:MAG TPA: hypothetical protein [Caudoviricetes sp.]
MAEKLILIGILILQVMTIGDIVEISDDVKAVRKLVTYLKEKESSVDCKFNYIRAVQTNIYGTLRCLLVLQESIEKQVKTNEKLSKPKIHQKWSDRNFRKGIKGSTDAYLDERGETDGR